jgi:hypothetical protein
MPENNADLYYAQNNVEEGNKDVWRAMSQNFCKACCISDVCVCVYHLVS